MTETTANPAIDSVEKIAAIITEMRTLRPSNYDAMIASWADRLAALAQTNDAGRGDAVPLGPAIVSMATAFQTSDRSKFIAYAREAAKHLGPHEKYLRRVCDNIETGKPPTFIKALAPPSGAGEPKIYTKADAEALCAIAVAAATSGTYESNCERIEKRLMEHRLSYTHGDDGDAYPLVDRLTPDGEKSIETGRKEIELLAENIADLFGKPEPPSGAAVRGEPVAFALNMGTAGETLLWMQDWRDDYEFHARKLYLAPPSGAAVRDMSAVEKAIDEYECRVIDGQHENATSEQIEEARAAVMDAIRALSTQPRVGDK